MTAAEGTKRRTRRPPLDLRTPPPGLAERFWSKVDRRGPDECWPWLAYRKPGGYGQFTLRKGVFVTASRVALALTGIVLGSDDQACHRCDNPPCCNPAHLFRGSATDNHVDCIAKGRGNKAQGEATGSARLTEDAVRAIRSTSIRYGTKAQLAREYGVSFRTIADVLAEERWVHVR